VKASRKRVLFWLRLAAAVLLLAIIFSRIDLPRLIETLQGVQLDLAIYSVVIGYFVPMFLCAWRWQSAWDGWAFGAPLATIPHHRFREYLRLFNVGWIVAHSP